MEKCDLCGKEFTTIRGLQLHKSYHAPLLESTTIQPTPTPIQNISYPTMQSIQRDPLDRLMDLLEKQMRTDMMLKTMDRMNNPQETGGINSFEQYASIQNMIRDQNRQLKEELRAELEEQDAYDTDDSDNPDAMLQNALLGAMMKQKQQPDLPIQTQQQAVIKSLNDEELNKLLEIPELQKVKPLIKSGVFSEGMVTKWCEANRIPALWGKQMYDLIMK